MAARAINNAAAVTIFAVNAAAAPAVPHIVFATVVDMVAMPFANHPPPAMVDHAIWFVASVMRIPRCRWHARHKFALSRGACSAVRVVARPSWRDRGR